MCLLDARFLHSFSRSWQGGGSPTFLEVDRRCLPSLFCGEQLVVHSYELLQTFLQFSIRTYFSLSYLCSSAALKSLSSLVRDFFNFSRPKAMPFALFNDLNSSVVIEYFIKEWKGKPL